MQNYILLDRDGVINVDSDDYIKSPEEWIPIEGSLEAITHLNQAGFKIVVISNQSGIGRGYYSLAVLEAMHVKMHRLLAAKGGKIERVYFCPHLASDQCRCRKPKTGLLETFSHEKNIPLHNMYFIGDSFSDIQAAQAVNAIPLLVKTGKGLKTLSEHPFLDIPVFENLYDAANYIITRRP
jgi:D-glycero-D-manno-heptose 1,7-bisphosphate phosphatase